MMKKRAVKYHFIFILCCLIALLSSCATHSFKRKKHQRKDFLGKKNVKKSKSPQGFVPTNSIQFNTFDYNDKNLEASVK